MIEVVNDNGMNRRTVLYQDLLYTMNNSNNPHLYSNHELQQYRFAVMEGVGGRETGEMNIARDYDSSVVPRLIGLEEEGGLIPSIIPNFFDLDILLIPVSQIRRGDQLVTLVREEDIIREKEEDLEKKKIEYMKSIDLDKYSASKIEVGNSPAKNINREEEEEDEETAAMMAAAEI